MNTIRLGVSSTMHTCIIASREKIKDWENGDLYHTDDKDEEWINATDAIAQATSQYDGYQDVSWAEMEPWERDNALYDLFRYESYDHFVNDEDFSIDTYDYTCENGDEIVVICQYG
mgnify:CR=1 FL=1